MTDRLAGPPGFPRISVAVMYHPARGDRIPRIAEACAPLRLVPVPDPDPGSFPSPLRTAKRAWAAWSPDATHHLVLQDDVLLVDGFSAHLRAAVAACPDDALALYAHWNSPYNSYAIRQAATGGASWARLVPGEWVPTQGLVLPVGLAKELGDYLAGVPDHVRDDDTVIDLFLRERDRRVLVTVPHLLDHDEVASVAGNLDHGVRRATVLLPGADLPAERWLEPPRFDKGAVMRGKGASTWDFSVTYAFGTCFLGFLRPTSEEFVRHPFGRWSDWCGVLGLGRADVLGGLEAYLASPDGRDRARALAEAGTAPGTAAELWAAAFLLGADVGTGLETGLGTGGGTGAPADLVGPLRRAAVTSWIDSGLPAADRALLCGGARAALADLGVAGLTRGLTADRGRAAPSDEPPAGEILRLLAVREAEGFLRTARFPPPLTVEVVTCPRCGAGPEEAAAYLRTVEFCALRVVRPGAGPRDGTPWLRMTGCERFPVHGLTLVADVRERLPRLSGEFVTRPAFLLDRRLDPDAPDPLPALAAVDAAERWADDFFAGRLSPSAAPDVMVLPVSTGVHRWAARPAADLLEPAVWVEEVSRYGRALGGHPLAPHSPESEAAERYRAIRDDLVRRRLTEITVNYPRGPRVNGRLDPAKLVRPW
ncbi:hypothetical protein [Microbispora triticiradicis]|uniref:Uncharacterized protein n=2 Tax=Microbispora TaxID=2005 RepID=A0ABY3LPD7_9ACTN|nr:MULTISPECIES: hypothetical protein [Microbispora]TLP58646.1 hypothetical protein FED44_17440 [Microbispora fusca]TYB45152.1 hypothetical protein FXF59_31925 [Microbispora tritici]